MKFLAIIKTSVSTTRVTFSQLSSIADYVENNFLLEKVTEITITHLL